MKLIIKRLMKFCEVGRKLIDKFPKKQGKIQTIKGIVGGLIALSICSFVLYNISYINTIPSCITILIGIILMIILFLWGLQECLSSCQRLIYFFIVDCVIFSAVGQSLFPNITFKGTDIIQYIAFIFIYTLSWIISVGIVDDKVAELACEIINSFTTIILLAANVFFAWLDQIGLLESFESSAELEIQVVGVLLLPIVVAGYSATVFIKCTRYIKAQEDTR